MLNCKPLPHRISHQSRNPFHNHQQTPSIQIAIYRSSSNYCSMLRAQSHSFHRTCYSRHAKPWKVQAWKKTYTPETHSWVKQRGPHTHSSSSIKHKRISTPHHIVKLLRAPWIQWRPAGEMRPWSNGSAHTKSTHVVLETIYIYSACVDMLSIHMMCVSA